MMIRKIAIILASASLLSACGTGGSYYYSNSDAYSYDSSHYYDESYGRQQSHQRRSRRPVSVTPGYHFSQGTKTPATHKERDKQWIQNQRNGYTVELADDEKAAAVAKRLHKSPKTNRAAQFKYKSNGKTRYKGVYGTYKTREEAEKARKSLPKDVRGSAKIRSWDKIQHDASKAPASNESAPISRPGISAD